MKEWSIVIFFCVCTIKYCLDGDVQGLGSCWGITWMSRAWVEVALPLTGFGTLES